MPVALQVILGLAIGWALGVASAKVQIAIAARQERKRRKRERAEIAAAHKLIVDAQIRRINRDVERAIFGSDWRRL